jgi:hypothetical protein
MLDVVKFTPKPLREIEAVEFTGGAEQAGAMIQWLTLLGGSAEWHDEDPGSHTRSGLREHIRIHIGSAYMFVYIGDYIMRDEEGQFKQLAKHVADLKYDRVVQPAPLVSIKTESEFDQALAA